VEFWIKSTTATVAGDFTLLLDNTALVVSALETLSIPALVADTWTFVRIALANPETDTAIISVGLNAANNIAANTVWINDVKAVRHESAKWDTLNRRLWSLDKAARTLILEGNHIGYRLLKLVGGDRAALLTADSGVTEVPEAFVIARATALCLMSGIGSPSMEAATRGKLADDWWTRSEKELRSLTNLMDVRTVSA
jgi:hypothetical protein